LLRATPLLLMLAAMVIAVATVLLITEDRLLTLGLHVGIAEYNAHMYSRLTVDEVRRDLLTPSRRRGVGSASRQRARS